MKKMPQKFIKVGHFIAFIVRHFIADKCRDHAMVLTYTTLFAVVPMMTVTFSILSAIPSMQHVSGDIQSFVFTHFVPSTGMVVEERLKEFSQQASHLTFVGIAMLFVTALLMLMNIEKAFNTIWRVKEERKGIVSFLRYWAVLSLGPLLLGMGFALSSYVMSLKVFSDANDLVSTIIPSLRIVTLTLTGLAFTLLYIAVPNCKVPLKAGLAGGFFAAILFELTKAGFGIFVVSFSSYKLIYGAFAAFPVFLLWVYILWCIILLGVQVSRGLAIYREDTHFNRDPVLAMLDVLQLFYRSQKQGTVVTDIQAMSILGRKEVDQWFEFAQILLDLKIIYRTDTGSYVLLRKLEDISFYEFYRKLPWPLPTNKALEKLHHDDHWVSVLKPALQKINANMESELTMSIANIVEVDTVAS